MSLFRSTIGRPASVEDTDAGEIPKRRIAAARACKAWTELDPTVLVAREGGYLVHADTDEAFKPYRGDAISAGGVLIADMTPLAYFVDSDGVHMLERQPRTWSEIVYQRSRTGARA